MCIRLFVFMITLNSLLHVTWLSFFFIEELSVGSACEPQRKLYAIESESQRFEVKKKKSFYDGKSSELWKNSLIIFLYFPFFITP